MATLSSVSLKMSQIEPLLPCAVTVALRIVRVSFVAPAWPAMPHLPVAFTVLFSMLRAELFKKIPQPSLLVALSVPVPLIVVVWFIVTAEKWPVILFVPLTCMFRSGTSELRMPWPLSPASIVAFSRVRVLVVGSYFAVPLTPSITLRSLQLLGVTFFPAIKMP